MIEERIIGCLLSGADSIELEGTYGYWENQHGDWSGIDDVDVIAWCELPEPYKSSPTGAEGSEE